MIISQNISEFMALSKLRHLLHPTYVTGTCLGNIFQDEMVDCVVFRRFNITSRSKFMSYLFMPNMFGYMWLELFQITD